MGMLSWIIWMGQWKTEAGEAELEMWGHKQIKSDVGLWAE